MPVCWSHGGQENVNILATLCKTDNLSVKLFKQKDIYYCNAPSRNISEPFTQWSMGGPQSQTFDILIRTTLSMFVTFVLKYQKK